MLAYQPSFTGPFFSDDLHYVKHNPFVQKLDLEAWREIWNPLGVLPRMTENYEPVHLMLRGFAWQLFGSDVRGHHVVNVLFHAMAATLLVPLFRRAGVGPWPATLGAGVFLLHPANVEAVAWIAQLKSSSALLLSLIALLVERRRPLLGALCFALALLAKPSALYALPVLAAALALEPGAGRARWRGFGLWVLVFAAFVVVELPAFFATAGSLAPLYDDVAVRLRSAFAIGVRYVWMAVTGQGLSMFHEPDPSASWLDPAWLAGLALLGLFAWRFVVVARARRVEAVFWVWAAAAFAPSSGILALPYPLADRYLYAVMPGLLGVVLLAGGEATHAWARRSGRSLNATPALGYASAALAVALVAVFGFQTHARASLWRSPSLLMADAARNYPSGTAAQLSAAVQAGRAGDAEGAARALRAAHRRGWNRLEQILAEPAYEAVRETPAFQAVVHEIADEHLRKLAEIEEPTQLDFQAMAVAHFARRDYAAATAALEEALRREGPSDAEIRRDLEMLRREAARP